jgi:hypothetical protein
MASDKLGKLIHEATCRFCQSHSWSDFVHRERGPSELQPHLHRRLWQPAAPLLQLLSKSGVPILRRSKPWSKARKEAAIKQGSHLSAKQHYMFLREEMANMINQKHWIILPYKYVHLLPYLCISPMGVVPQRDRRSRAIVDYSFSGLNQDTIALSPFEAMQFGRALERILQQIHFANRKYGPVFLIKVDIADGFYRLCLADGSIPSFGVAFPSIPGEEHLVAFPLVLPMGWVASPPYFCALTETIANIANINLRQKIYPLHNHRLHSLANNPTEKKPVGRRPSTIAIPAIETLTTSAKSPATPAIPILATPATPPLDPAAAKPSLSPVQPTVSGHRTATLPRQPQFNWHNPAPHPSCHQPT